MISELELLAGPFHDIAEGPVWDGHFLTFTLIRQSRIMRYDPISRTCSEWASETRRTNGLAHDSQGRLYGCSAETRALLRFDGGNSTILFDRFEGLPLNTPNDLAIDRAGRIWFTNPWNPPLAPDGGAPEIAQDVFRADRHPDGRWNLVRCSFDMTKPNGIALSPDERILYVAQSDFDEGRLRELRAYPVLETGLGAYATLYTFGIDHRGVQRGIDGMCIDALGNIVATAGWPDRGPGPLLYLFAPSGRILATREVPTVEGPTNCAFGGPDMRTLFVTTIEGSVLAARMEVPGLPIGPLRSD